MYRWKIEIVLNSGKELTVYYEGIEDNSDAVANTTLTGPPNNLSGFSNEDGTKNVFVKLGEVAYFAISAS
jgi:hypothetical protein